MYNVSERVKYVTPSYIRGGYLKMIVVDLKTFME